MLPSAEWCEQVRRAVTTGLVIASFPFVYLAVWSVCRAFDWPKPTVLD